jgi:hypothetical protein
MNALRLSLLSLLMLAMPLTGLAAATAPGCAMQQLAAPVIEPASPAQDLHHRHHGGMDHGMDMSAMDADMHARHADAASPEDAGCLCGCLCAGSCIAAGVAAMSLALPGSLAPLNSTEAPALPQTVATRASITDDLLRPPTATV